MNSIYFFELLFFFELVLHERNILPFYETYSISISGRTDWESIVFEKTYFGVLLTSKT